MANPNTPTIIMAPSPKQNGIIDYAFKGVVAIALFFGGRWAYRKWQANKTSDAAGGDINVQFATEIHQAIDGAGTSEKVLFDLANRITDWVEVSKAYRKLYNANMLEAIKDDLDPKDYQKFMNLYNLGQKNSDGSPKVTKNVIAAGLLVIAEKEVYIRKTPVYQKVLTGAAKILDPLNLFNSNAVALVKPGKLIGVSTGAYSDDIKSPSGTRFIEVKVPLMDENKKHELVSMWVASSQVKTFSGKGIDIATKYKGNMTIVFKKNYNSALSGIGDLISNIKIISSHDLVGVYSESNTLIDFVRKKDVVLGFKLKQQSNDLDMVTYQTIDGTIRNSFRKHTKELTELQ